MRPIPFNFLTLYADLAQSFEFPEGLVGSVTRRTIQGKSYLYVTSKDGSARIQTSLGPASEPRVQEKARAVKAAQDRARNMRTVVSTLKQKARIPAPTLAMGRVLEVVSNAGLFRRGVTLVGTAAYQTYPCLIGHYLATAAFATNDIDLSVVEFDADGRDEDLHKILRRADPSFAPEWSNEDALPRVFTAANGLRVDILTRYGRGVKSAIPVAGLGCAAVALRFQEFPVEDTIEAVALYGRGVLVRVPTPIRYALHKLIVAQRRAPAAAAKKAKDLRQAEELLDIFLATDETALLDALDAARDRGQAWRTAINASLREIGRTARQGELPTSKP